MFDDNFFIQIRSIDENIDIHILKSNFVRVVCFRLKLCFVSIFEIQVQNENVKSRISCKNYAIEIV